VLAALLERWEDAEAHFAAAAEANERMGFRPWLARTHEQRAAMVRGAAR